MEFISQAMAGKPEVQRYHQAIDGNGQAVCLILFLIAGIVCPKESDYLYLNIEYRRVKKTTHDTITPKTAGSNCRA